MLPVGGQDVTRALELFLKHTRADQVYSICDFDQLVVEDIKVRIALNPRQDQNFLISYLNTVLYK